jgi:hypothetical protein
VGRLPDKFRLTRKSKSARVREAARELDFLGLPHHRDPKMGLWIETRDFAFVISDVVLSKAKVIEFKSWYLSYGNTKDGLKKLPIGITPLALSRKNRGDFKSVAPEKPIRPSTTGGYLMQLDIYDLGKK